MMRISVISSKKIQTTLLIGLAYPMAIMKLMGMSSLKSPSFRIKMFHAASKAELAAANSAYLVSLA